MTSASKRMKPVYQLRHADKINNTPVMPLLAEAWHAIATAGHCSNTIPVNWDHSAVYFEHRGKPVAVITYAYTDWNHQVWIYLGYVQPKHRGKGLYRQLYQEVRKLAVEKGACILASGIDVKNKAMQEAAKAVGRSPMYIAYGEHLESTLCAKAA